MCNYEFFRDKVNRVVIELRDFLGDEEHFHNCVEFIYAISGEAIAHIDGREYRFSSGQVCVVSSFSTHYYEKITDGEFMVCLIPRRYYRENDHIFNNSGFKNPIITDAGNKPLLNLIYQAKNIAKSKDIWGTPENYNANDYTELQLYHLCTYLINIFIHHCGLYECEHISSLVADAIGLIETHFKEKLNVFTLSTMLNCKQQDLSSGFRKTLGMSVLDYIERARMNEAARLLLQYPNMTNEKIMTNSGYQNSRSFLRHFKSTYQCTPAEYKENMSASNYDK